MITVKITMKISKARTDELLVVIYHMFRNGVDDWVTVMIFQKKLVNRIHTNRTTKKIKQFSKREGVKNVYLTARLTVRGGSTFKISLTVK